MSFEMGDLYMTAGIAQAIEEDASFLSEVQMGLFRHKKCDWGDLCEEDKETNDDALHYGGRLFSAYETSRGKVWIITEADRSVTTVLWPDEY